LFNISFSVLARAVNEQSCLKSLQLSSFSWAA
jgi:hypothetical protein